MIGDSEATAEAARFKPKAGHGRARDATGAFTTLVVQLYRAHNLAVAIMDALAASGGSPSSTWRKIGASPDHCYSMPPEQVAAGIGFE